MPGLRMVDHSPGTNSNRDFRGCSLLSSSKFFQSLTSRVLAARLARTSNAIAAPLVFGLVLTQVMWFVQAIVFSLQQAMFRTPPNSTSTLTPARRRPWPIYVATSLERGGTFARGWKAICLGVVISSTPSSTDDSRSERSRDPSVKINSSWSPSSQPCMVHPPSSSSPHPRAWYTALRGRLDLERFWHESSWLHLEAWNTSTRPTWGSASRSCCLFVAKSWRSCGSSSKAGCRTSSGDTPDPSGSTCKHEIKILNYKYGRHSLSWTSYRYSDSNKWTSQIKTCHWPQSTMNDFTVILEVVTNSPMKWLSANPNNDQSCRRRIAPVRSIFDDSPIPSPLAYF